MTKGNENKLPIYDKPPLVELVIGARFSRLEAFKAPYFGLFWNLIMEEFPRCEEAPPIFGDPTEIDPTLSRIWLLNATDDHLLQIQKDIFLLNWRRKEGRYPHFNAIHAMYSKYWNEFRNFLDNHSIDQPKVKTYELSYIDHISRGEGWNDIKDILSMFSPISWDYKDANLLNNPLTIGVTTFFRMPDDMGQLHIKINHAKRAHDNQEIVNLEMTARSDVGTVADGEMEIWFKAAHDFVVRAFRELCSDSVQTTFWKRRDD